MGQSMRLLQKDSCYVGIYNISPALIGLFFGGLAMSVRNSGAHGHGEAGYQRDCIEIRRVSEAGYVAAPIRGFGVGSAIL